MSKTLTQERLKKLLHYDPETGIFIRLVKTSFIKIGDIAGYHSHGYITFSVDGKEYLAHRLSFLYMEGYFPENDVDHINRIRDDNRWCNLRHVTHKCNLRNCSLSKNNKSGINGVSWSKAANKWESCIKVDGEKKYLGIFETLKEAAQVRWKAEVKYDFPNCNTTSSAYQYLQENE